MILFSQRTPLLSLLLNLFRSLPNLFRLRRPPRLLRPLLHQRPPRLLHLHQRPLRLLHQHLPLFPRQHLFRFPRPLLRW
ncbi:hypothetical protein [Arthrobacter sp. 131MFCol6.1]|uniref:hypothetical protein n=1 Tax=Arthrobacter sp. 131MFCol6.1 TaxID=1157944 RepID=UPI00037FDB17|nr:hypothetical protein [Arthrobacter sp. 131MFCol6.1]